MRRAVALLVALSLLVAMPAPSVTATDLLRAGFAPSGKLSHSHTSKGACATFVKMWGQEMGLSGVTRLRARFERRSPYDPGWLPTYGKTAWQYSAYFPNDYRSHYQWFWSTLVYPSGGRYSLRFVLIGERPSFWQRDLRRSFGVTGGIGCERWMPSTAHAPGGA
jgi:hypothetical protein